MNKLNHTESDFNASKGRKFYMELFHEIYGCYYHIINEILDLASKKPVTKQALESLIRELGYSESSLAILPKLINANWPFLEQLDSNCSSARIAPVHLPYTNLQLSWMKSLLSDRRIRLFLNEEEIQTLLKQWESVEPLFSFDTFHYYDQYQDGDPYESLTYQDHFRKILYALQNKCTLHIIYFGKSKAAVHEVAPYQLQYSSKDDKFRLCCLKYRNGSFKQKQIFNLSRIDTCQIGTVAIPNSIFTKFCFTSYQRAKKPVVIEISGARNSLERCMLHFANYEKHTEYDEEKQVYRCSIYYDSLDETELLIQVLSFGPVIRVIEPPHFLNQIKKRVQHQHELFYRDLSFPEI